MEVRKVFQNDLEQIEDERLKKSMLETSYQRVSSIMLIDELQGIRPNGRKIPFQPMRLMMCQFFSSLSFRLGFMDRAIWMVGR